MSLYARRYAAALAPARYTHAGEADFHAAMHAGPDDHLHSLVYADWLDERGHAAKAAVVRADATAAANAGGGLPPPPRRPWPNTEALGHDGAHPWTAEVDHRASARTFGRGWSVLSLRRTSEHAPDTHFRWVTGGPRPAVQALYDRLLAEGVAPATPRDR